MHIKKHLYLPNFARHFCAIRCYLSNERIATGIR